MIQHFNFKSYASYSEAIKETLFTQWKDSVKTQVSFEKIRFKIISLYVVSTP